MAGRVRALLFSELITAEGQARHALDEEREREGTKGRGEARRDGREKEDIEGKVD